MGRLNLSEQREKLRRVQMTLLSSTIRRKSRLVENQIFRFDLLNAVALLDAILAAVLKENRYNREWKAEIIHRTFLPKERRGIRLGRGDEFEP